MVDQQEEDLEHGLDHVLEHDLKHEGEHDPEVGLEHLQPQQVLVLPSQQVLVLSPVLNQLPRWLASYSKSAPRAKHMR